VDGEKHGLATVRWTAATAALLLAIAGVFSARSARSEGKLTLNGTWSASSLTESWSVTDWGDACGPKPTGHGSGGGSVKVQEGGGELSFSGAGRSFSTAECWEQMPGLARTSHSASGGGRAWTTRCSSPANDPRHAAVVTRIQASDTSISLSETGQYQFLIHDTTCSAQVSRSRSYSLVKREGDEPPAPSATAAPVAIATATAEPKPPPEPKPSSKCVAGSAGEPARLEVHPAKKLLRAGEHFVFRAAVLDAEGCPTGARPTWAIGPGPIAAKATIDAAGTLAVEAGADEGKLEVVASILGKSVTVPVEVTSADHYDALLAAGRDGAGDENDTAVAVIATGTIGGRTAVADDKAHERKTTFLAIVVGLSLTLGFVGLVLARRGRRPDLAPESAGAPAGGGEGDESDEEDPIPGSEASAAEAPAPMPPVATPAPAAKAAPRKAASRGKICPTCGERYPSEAVFCGKDATSLVLLN
jgi:hypothetical protein